MDNRRISARTCGAAEHYVTFYQMVTMMTKLHIAHHISLRDISGRLERT